jgi:multiple sugar transport system substrate-binding protein
MISRRQVTFGGAALAGAALVQQPAAAQSFDWTSFRGTRINVLFARTPKSDLLQRDIKEFESLTGIQVSLEAIPEQQQRQKMVVEFTSGSPSFDITNINLGVQKRLAGRGRWFADLKPMLDSMAKRNPEFDMADFLGGTFEFSTQSDGRIDTMPYNLDYWILYYNKELLERAGVAYPKTFDDLVKAAERTTDKSRNTFGWVSRGLKNANTPVWTTFMLGMGQQTLSGDRRLLTSNDEAVAAAELYKKLNRDFAPPGVVGFNWSECQTTFAQGRAAFWLDGIGFAAPLEDASRSRVVGKVGYGLMPAGPKGHGAALWQDAVGISARSRNQEAAFLFLIWSTNKINQTRMLQAGAGIPVRRSPLLDPNTRKEARFGNENFDTIIQSAPIGKTVLPDIIPVTQFRDIYGIALTNMIEGADPRKELEEATRQFQPILDQSERA